MLKKFKSLDLQSSSIEQKLLSKDWKIWMVSAVMALVFALISWFFVLAHQPIEKLQKDAHRPQYVINLWQTCGFRATVGLSFSECPQNNPQALVYQTRPPAYLYPYYLFLRISRSSFNINSLLFANIALLWSATVLIGYLGIRLIQDFNFPVISTILLAGAGQFIFFTFPFNLKLFDLPYEEFYSVIFLLGFLITEERILSTGSSTILLRIFRFLSIFLMTYMDKPFGLIAITIYILLIFLLDRSRMKDRLIFWTVLIPAFSGAMLHLAQLALFKLNWPETTFIGGSFLWRSGFDGATNYVGILTIGNLGEYSPAVRYLTLLLFIPLLFMLFRLDRHHRMLNTFPVYMAGCYLVFGFTFSQMVLIHYNVYDLFLIPITVLLIYLVVPSLESLTKNTGAITFIVLILALCLVMYQFRVFAIANPQALPEPPWREYIDFG